MPEIPTLYRLFTAAESVMLDSFSIESLDIPGQTLMEVAGAKAAEQILTKYSGHSRALVLCGRGNNAGDALVASRYLVRHGITFTVIFISGTDKLSPETRKNLDLLRKTSDLSGSPADIHNSWDAHAASRCNADLVIDGMLGTGLNSDLHGDYAKAVKWAVNASLPVYSMDIPTGLHTDTGCVMGTAIRATHTFAFGTLKTGYYLESGPSHCGQIHFCDLGFPDSLNAKTRRYLIRPEWVDTFPLPDRKPRHKYEAGILYIIAGSEGLTGAAVMAARSAWSEGPGAVIVIGPRGLEPAFEKHLIQQVKKPVGSSSDLFFRKEHASRVIEIMNERPGTILLGPGLGRNSGTVAFVHTILQHNPPNLVIDADGLWCLAQIDSIPEHPGSEWILTPHPGELNQLLKKDFKTDYDRMEGVIGFAEAQNLYIVSKGNPVVVADPERNVCITDYDTTIFSRSGYGDILAGKIGAFCAMGLNPTISSVSALLNGKHKYDHVKSINADHSPEPLDLI